MDSCYIIERRAHRRSSSSLSLVHLHHFCERYLMDPLLARGSSTFSVSILDHVSRWHRTFSSLKTKGIPLEEMAALVCHISYFSFTLQLLTSSMCSSARLTKLPFVTNITTPPQRRRGEIRCREGRGSYQVLITRRRFWCRFTVCTKYQVLYCFLKVSFVATPLSHFFLKWPWKYSELYVTKSACFTMSKSNFRAVGNKPRAYV